MPITHDVDLPIRHVAISGPAVEALERRKESSTNPRIEALELRESFNNVKDTLFAGIKALGHAIAKPSEARQGQWGGA